MSANDTGYEKVLKTKEMLAVFLRQLKKFNDSFCRLMMGGEDFVLRLEVRGCNRKLIHMRVYTDETERPSPKDNSVGG